MGDSGSTRRACDMDARACIRVLAAAWTGSGERSEQVAEELKNRGSAAVLPSVNALAAAGTLGLRRSPSPHERHRGCRSLFG
jgi:hypothetical protein